MDQSQLHDMQKVFDSILSEVPDELIGLPRNGFISQEDKEFSCEIMKEVEAYIGVAASSDYYTTSRERFAVIIACARRYLREGTLLDIGNAPGFLGYAFHKAGFEVSGLNLSDAYLEIYPNPEMVNLFNIISCDIEKTKLPFGDGMFDAILFTEVLEHIAIKNPKEILIEFKRVLKPSGIVLFSTPNICNLSNIIALMTGNNVFWPENIFYGSTDRHNREYSPKEVRSLFEDSGFGVLEFFGVNDHANWRAGTQELIYPYLAKGREHPLLRNTIVGVFVS